MSTTRQLSHGPPECRITYFMCLKQSYSISKPTRGDLEGFAGDAVTLSAPGHGVDGVGVAAEQLVENQAGVGGVLHEAGAVHGGRGVHHQWSLGGGPRW